MGAIVTINVALLTLHVGERSVASFEEYMQRDFARAASLRLLRERQGLVAFIHERAKVRQLLQQCIR